MSQIIKNNCYSIFTIFINNSEYFGEMKWYKRSDRPTENGDFISPPCPFESSYTFVRVFTFDSKRNKEVTPTFYMAYVDRRMRS